MPTTSLQKTSFTLYLFGVFLLAVSMPWSKFLMSNAQIILLISWLMDAALLEKLKKFRKNKTALVLSSMFLLHIIGLCYTTDMHYGMEDVRKKIPLMLLPLIFSTSSPISKQMLEKILSMFVLSVVMASMVCFIALLGYTKKEILEPRDASIFISHIRFSLMISIAIFMLGYFFHQNKNLLFKILYAGVIFWLLLFLLMMEAETGIICVIAVTLLLLFYFFLKIEKVMLKLALIPCILLSVFWGGYFLFSNQGNNNEKNSEYNNTLPILTKTGNTYFNDTVNQETENGNNVWIRLCEKELEEEWNKKSNLNYSEKDLKGNELKYTLIRFMTSKGLNKDSEGVNLLSEEEIKSIEKGKINVNYIGILNPFAGVSKIKWEFENYLRGGNPSGHSVTQRFEFWKAAIGIIKENFWLGVGTGDSKIAFEKQYEKINSPLKKEWRFRSHNQFFAIAVALGIFGLLWFLFTLFYPVIKEKKIFSYLYFTFFATALLSFFAEDTLETQAGVTFFAFFNSLFLFCQKKEDHTVSSSR